MKRKILFGTIAMAAVMSISCTFSAMNASAATKNQLDYDFQTINELIDLQTKASLANDQTALQKIDTQLSRLGVEEISYSEFQAMNTNSGELSLLDDGGIITVNNHNRYQRYSVDFRQNGVDCIVMVVYVTPDDELSSLHHTEVIAEKSSKNINKYTDLISIVCNTIASNVNETFGVALSIYDAFKDIYNIFDNDTVSVIEDITASYTVQAIEQLCFLYTPSPITGGGYNLQNISNRVDINILAAYINFAYNGVDYSESGIQPVSFKEFYNSNMYGNYRKIGEYLSTGVKNYGLEERMKSFDIYGPNQSYLYTMPLSNAMIPGNV